LTTLNSIASPLLRQAQTEEIPLNPALVRELASLSRETDAEIFYGDLLRLSRRFQERDRHDWALKLYARVAEQSEFPELARRARASIAALEGRGATGARAEVLLSRFVKDASDPAMILPMLAGTTVAGLVRGAGFGALARRSASWYSRGWGARFTAGSTAFAAEVPTFVIAGRALRGSEPQNTWGHDFQSAVLSLGAIKLFSLAGKQGLAQLHGVNKWGAITRGAAFAGYSHPLIHQASLFGGLMIAHRAETYWGLRPEVEEATAVTDTLSSMLSLGAGMRLGTGLLGPSYAQAIRKLERPSRPHPKIPSLPNIELSLERQRRPATQSMIPANAMAMDPFDLLDLILLAPGGRSSSSNDHPGPIPRKGTGGQLQAFSSLKEEVPSLSPAELENARLKAEDFFKKTSFEGLSGNRRDEINTGLAAIRFLETAAPHAEPERRAPYVARFTQLALRGPKELAPAALVSFKRSLPLIGPSDRAAIANLLRSDFGKSKLDWPATPYFLFAEVASELPPAQKRSELQEALRSLDANKVAIDTHSLALLENQRLLRDFATFAEGIHRDDARDTQNRLQLLEANSGGIFQWFRNRKIDGLRRTLADLPEMPFPALLQKFKAESENPLARRFNLESSVLEVQRVRELLGQEQPEPATVSADFSLRKYFQQEALRQYLGAEPSYFENFNEQGLRDRMINRLRVESGYRELFIDPDGDPKGSGR
jgi:hypothetical protein